MTIVDPDVAHVMRYHAHVAHLAIAILDQHVRDLCPVCILQRFHQCPIGGILHKRMTEHANEFFALERASKS